MRIYGCIFIHNVKITIHISININLGIILNIRLIFIGKCDNFTLYFFFYFFLY